MLPLPSPPEEDEGGGTSDLSTRRCLQALRSARRALRQKRNLGIEEEGKEEEEEEGKEEEEEEEEEEERRLEKISRNNSSELNDADTNHQSNDDDEEGEDEEKEEEEDYDDDKEEDYDDDTWNEDSDHEHMQASSTDVGKKEIKSNAKIKRYQLLDQKAVSPLNHSIAHLTKSWSLPVPSYCIFAKNGMIHSVKMIHGREMNVSKIGRWSRAECCHMAARYLPTDSPKIIDQMNCRVYVGQFSSDGSLFVGGFQERHIRIYNVNQGWSLKKDILARQLRWTVTDTALSHDQRFLIYASISPMVYLVNIGNESGVESLANITVLFP